LGRVLLEGERKYRIRKLFKGLGSIVTVIHDYRDESLIGQIDKSGSILKKSLDSFTFGSG